MGINLPAVLVTRRAAGFSVTSHQHESFDGEEHSCMALLAASFVPGLDGKVTGRPHRELFCRDTIIAYPPAGSCLTQ